MNINTANLQGIYTSYSLIFQEAFGSTPTFYKEIATVVPSTGRSNTYGWMDKLPRLREWLGERVINNVKARGYVLPNRKFELTEGLSCDDIADDQLGIFRPILEYMAQSASSHPDDLIAELLRDGQNKIAHDNQFFFDTDHPTNQDDPSSPTYSNYFTGTALNQANFAAIRAQMMSYKGSDGKSLKVRPNILAVPPLLENMAKTIVEAELINKGGVQESNVYKGVAKVLVLDDLAGGVGDTEWYLFDTTKPIRPFVYQERLAPEFTMRFDPTDPSVFDNDEFLYGIKTRGNAGYSLPFLAAKARA